jgi:hypothetical protein
MKFYQNKGMKYGDSRLNAPGSRTFVVPGHIAASSDWLKEFRKRKDRAHSV